MYKIVVSVLALPQGELGWISANGSNAHDKGQQSSIKILSCSSLSEEYMSCFRGSRNSRVPYLIQTQPILVHSCMGSIEPCCELFLGDWVGLGDDVGMGFLFPPTT